MFRHASEAHTCQRAEPGAVLSPAGMPQSPFHVGGLLFCVVFVFASPAMQPDSSGIFLFSSSHGVNFLAQIRGMQTIQRTKLALVLMFENSPRVNASLSHPSWI